MKKVLSIVLLCAVILSAVSCGNTPAVTEATGTTAPAETSSAEETPGTTTADTTVSDAETDAPETEGKEIPEDMEYKIENGINERMKALSELVPGNKARLAKVLRRAQAGEEITVAYLGGSITQGSSAGPGACYADLTTKWLQEQFPDAKITAVNAGIGATGSYIGVYRTDRDVLVHKPDLVFIDFSVNDTTEHTQRNIESYDGVLRKLWLSESAPAIVTIAMTMEDGTSFQEQHSAVCAAYDIPMISYKNAILDVIDNGHIVGKDISDDNIHPNVPGHAVLTELITSYLQGVIDELDTIDTEKESDFSTVYASDKYSTALGSSCVSASSLAARRFSDLGSRVTGPPRAIFVIVKPLCCQLSAVAALVSAVRAGNSCCILAYITPLLESALRPASKACVNSPLYCSLAKISLAYTSPAFTPFAHTSV